MRVLLPLFVLLVLLPRSSAADPASEVVVVVSRRGFDPPELTVDRGTIVAFHRRDPGPGTYRIVSEDGSLESWSFAQYTQWSHRFEEPGRYELHLAEHPDTRIRIRVR